MWGPQAPIWLLWSQGLVGEGTEGVHPCKKRGRSRA